MVLGGAAGNAHNSPAGVHIPVGCAQSGKGRNNIHPAVIRHLLGVILRIPAFLDHAQAIAHPLDDRPAHKHTALQRILHLAVQADGNGGQQAIFAAADGIAGVHQQKAAGTIGVFGFAFGKTALAKQCGLLVARNTGHRHLYAAQVGVTVNLAGIRHTRQHTCTLPPVSFHTSQLSTVPNRISPACARSRAPGTWSRIHLILVAEK